MLVLLNLTWDYLLMDYDTLMQLLNICADRCSELLPYAYDGRRLEYIAWVERQAWLQSIIEEEFPECFIEDEDGSDS